MGVATGEKKKKSDLNQPTTFIILHPWPGLLHKPPLSSLHSFQYFLGASIFLNTASLISEARQKVIPGILWWGDIKTHLEVSVEASLHTYFSQLRLSLARWSQPEGAGGFGSAAAAGTRWAGLMKQPRGLFAVVGCPWCVCGRRGLGTALFRELN